MPRVILSENREFIVTWEYHGQIRSKAIGGLNDLTEFIRNCDVYERRLVSITNLTPEVEPWD
ncbi:hypothetical protein SEA_PAULODIABOLI_345 [Microbacterium phage PauloDiaboli]|nr:hypothetical protein SEA_PAULODIABOLI_345 [Microbacterium phage PauloDiaboli]